MERKFTLRVSQSQSEQLKQLRKLTGHNNDAAVIRYIVDNFENLNDRYLSVKKDSREWREKYETLNNKVGNFNSAFQTLVSVKLEE